MNSREANFKTDPFQSSKKPSAYRNLKPERAPNNPFMYARRIVRAAPTKLHPLVTTIEAR